MLKEISCNWQDFLSHTESSCADYESDWMGRVSASMLIAAAQVYIAKSGLPADRIDPDEITIWIKSEMRRYHANLMDAADLYNEQDADYENGRRSIPPDESLLENDGSFKTITPLPMAA